MRCVGEELTIEVVECPCMIKEIGCPIMSTLTGEARAAADRASSPWALSSGGWREACWATHCCSWALRCGVCEAVVNLDFSIAFYGHVVVGVAPMWSSNMASQLLGNGPERAKRVLRITHLKLAHHQILVILHHHCMGPWYYRMSTLSG